MSVKMLEQKADATNFEGVLDQIDQIVKVSIIDTIEMPRLKRVAKVATGMKQIRDIVSRPDVISLFLPLKGLARGFLTDEKEIKYTDQEIADALTDGFIAGALPIDNEINIIAKRCYLAKAFFERVTREYPGVTNLTYDVGVPATSPNGALVPFFATWIQNGEERKLSLCLDEATKTDLRIPVRINSNMGVDGVIGKAIRKGLRKVYERMGGTTAGILDDDDAPRTDGKPTAKDRIQSAIDSTKEKVA